MSSTLPSVIPGESARALQQSLIAFNGVLLGFGAIVFGRLLDRAQRFRDLSYTLVFMTATIALYIVAVMNSLYALAISASGLVPEEITGPLGFTMFATTVLFFTLYIQMVSPFLTTKPET